jgi:hypothetical protein
VFTTEEVVRLAIIRQLRRSLSMELDVALHIAMSYRLGQKQLTFKINTVEVTLPVDATCQEVETRLAWARRQRGNGRHKAPPQLTLVS